MARGTGVIQGRGVTRGVARGAVILIDGPFTFAHGVEPSSGDINDLRCNKVGENIRNKVVVFPFGRGSTTGSAWLLETVRRHNGPAAVINVEAEPILATGIIIGELLYGVKIPLVDRPGEDVASILEDGAMVEVNGDTGRVTIEE